MTAERLFPNASKLGCGCASLGSRVGAKRGLEVLALAFDHGANWYDLAPSYGDGRAQTIFRDFARGKREKLYICTKVGVAAPQINPLLQVVKPFARQIVRTMPGLRRAVGSVRSVQPVEIRPDEIRTSLESSLRDLGTDYVDVLALHDPAPSVLQRQDVFSVLVSLREEGKVRGVGVAGSSEIATLAMQHTDVFDHVQYAIDLSSDENPSGTLRARSHIVHSVISGSGELLELLTKFDCKTDAQEVFKASGYQDDLEANLKALALDFALARPGLQTVLVSMLSPRSIERNFQRLANGSPDRQCPSATVSALFELVGRRNGDN